MSAAGWNPNAPDVVGLEWAPNVVGQSSIGIAPAPTSIVTATVSETITALRAYIATLTGTSAASTIVTDIYDATDPAAPPWAVIPGGGATYPLATASPNADVAATVGVWTAENGATANFWQHLDENALTLDTTNYVDYRHPGHGVADMRFRATSAFKDVNDGINTIDISHRRILAVTVRVWVKNASTRGIAVIGDLGINVLGDYSVYFGPAQAVHAGAGVEVHAFTFRTNPATRRPWTHPDLAQFGPGGTADFGYRVYGTLNSGANDYVRFYAVQLEVTYCAETRVATSYVGLGAPQPTAAWRTMALFDVFTDAATTWQKTAGHTYWIVMHQPTGSLPAVWYFLDGAPLAGIGAQQTPLTPLGLSCPDPTATWPPPTDTRAHALLFGTGAGAAYSPDSQPYASVGRVDVAQGVTVQQALTPPAAVPYGLGFIWARAPSGAFPTATLDVTVVDTGAGTVVAGPAMIVPIDATGDIGTFRRYLVEFSSPFTPVAGHQYAVHVASGTITDAPWHVAILDTLDVGVPPGTASAGDTGYGGTSTAATVITATNIQQDAPLAIAQLPAALGDVAVDLYAQTLGALVPTPSACAVTVAGAIVVSWTPTLLTPGVFAYTEVQRFDGPDGYQAVAKITDPTVGAFYDFEARRNTVASYRVRQVRLDGAHSPWSTVASATVLAATTDFLLVTNVIPDLNVGYIHEPTGQSYEFLDSAAVVKRQLFGRDFQVAYRPLERRGDHFKRTVTVAFNDPSRPVGRVAFDALTAIARARIPYVAVLDGDGNRWYASVTIASGVRDEPGGRYHADVDVTEVSGVAAPVRFAWNPGLPPGPPGTQPGTLYGDPGGVYGDVGSTYGT